MGDVLKLDTIEHAIEEIRAGRPVIVVDDEDRENEGDLIFAASKATPELLAFLIRYSSGVVCVPMEGAELDRLGIPLMTPHNRERMRTAYTISVDARDGIATGISAADRSHTIRVLADSATEPHDLVQPGHVMPLRYREGGVLARPGHTEASVDLARLAGLTPAGVLCEIVNEDGSMMRASALREFADDHGLAMISIADLIRYRRRHESQIERIAQTRMPTVHGTFDAHAYRDTVTGGEHVALVVGDVRDGEPVLVRVHSECLTGDTFGSLRCDCGEQLESSLAQIETEGRGAVVYLAQEGRGIGLLNKLKAYKLQDTGLDTVDANLELGLPVDLRDYGIGAQILSDLGLSSIRILTNNPKKIRGLEGYGLSVTEQIPIVHAANPHNERYLQAKRDRLGHTLHHQGLALDEQMVHDEHERDRDVAGAFELPLAAAYLASTERYDGVACLGAVIRGETDHYDYVCSEAARGIQDVQLRTGVPCAFGVLTVENMDQALARAGGGKRDQGEHAAQAVLALAALRRDLGV